MAHNSTGHFGYRGRILSTPFRHIIVYTATFLFCFILSLIAGSLILKPQGTKAVTGLTLVPPPSLKLDVLSTNLTMQIVPTSTGTLASTSHEINTATDAPTGYSLSLATATGPTLMPINGTFAAPTPLINNTWGYAVPGAGGFDASYTTPTPSNTSKWANPTTPTTIKTTTNSTSGDATTVYYGAKADTILNAGTYTNTVRYTLVANIADIPVPTIISITPNSGSTAGGTPITIIGTGFTINDQSVTSDVTIDGIACQNVSISSNTPTTGQDTIYCNSPARPTAGSVAVAVSTWRSTATTANGYTYAAPTPTITAPTARQIFSAGTTNTDLIATTDYPAICYYGSTSSNPSTQMTTTGGINHSINITGLANVNTATFYVRCQAATGHSYSPNASVTFYIRTATPPAPTSFRPANGAILGAGINQVNNISATTAVAITCTYTSNKGTLTADDITNLTAGTITINYSCTAGSGNTISEPRTGSWSFTIDTPVTTGVTMQTVSRATQCPANTYIRAQDARDTATYWIKRIEGYPNGSENTLTTYDAALPPNYSQCWMLTNLAYGGGGTNTYGDVKTISNGGTYNTSNTTPYYFIPPGANRTTGTTNPSTSTTGIGQYGYLYNWCAAMGGQSNACDATSTTGFDTKISICPAGWKLPTGGQNGNFYNLNTIINSGSTTSDSGLRSTWLGMYGGTASYNTILGGGFHYQDDRGSYWSSSLWSMDPNIPYALYFNPNEIQPANANRYVRPTGISVRCVQD